MGKRTKQSNIVLVSEYKHLPEDAKIVLEINSRTDIRGKDGKQIPTVEIYIHIIII